MEQGKRRKKQKSAPKPIIEAFRSAAKMAASTSPSHAETQIQPRPPCSSAVSDSESDSCTRSPSPLLFSDTTEAIMTRFDRMLKDALKGQTAQLTAEIRALSIRTSAIEDRVDILDISVSDLGRHVTALQDDNLQLQLKMEDLENRSRRSNLRIRGIPEHVTDVHATALALLQELAPSLPLERLEMDRVHRALTRLKPDGPPRDIILKMHYFRSKELLLQHARDKAKTSDLLFQGHLYQIFNDIAPTTIARRREMRPFLEVLRSHGISYRWGFPFKLLFTYQGKVYASVTPSEAKAHLTRLRLTLSADTAIDNSADSPQKKRPRKIPLSSPAPGPAPSQDSSDMT